MASFAARVAGLAFEGFGIFVVAIVWADIVASVVVEVGELSQNHAAGCAVGARYVTFEAFFVTSLAHPISAVVACGAGFFA